MAGEEPEKGTRENPLTREDVLEAIEGNGGTARGLDLSGKWFEAGINLQDLPLEGINLQNGIFPAHIEGSRPIGARFDGSSMLGANLRHASLQDASFGIYGSMPTAMQGVDLRGAHLESASFQGAVLIAAQFRETEIAATTEPWAFLKHRESLPAYLDNTDFRYAVLTLAQFKGCYFHGTKLEGAFIRDADITEAHLGDADWGNHKIGEEEEGDKKKGQEKEAELRIAEHRYRQLKQWYTNSGYYDIAGEFLFREMETKRKRLCWLHAKERRWLGWWPLRGEKVRLSIYRWLYGYGERPWRVVLWGMVILLGLAAAYYFWGSFDTASFLDTLYYSAASFTALGYGQWAPQPTGWAKAMGAVEAFIGVFSIALFLVTFTRKMTR